MIKKAVIPAAGYGTRSLPITKVIPKEMFPIGGRPAIHYVVEEAVESGIEEILIIISRTKNLIMDYFDHSLELEAFLERANKTHLLEKTKLPNVHIQYVRQSHAKGLGDAISLAKPFTGKEPFAVMLPDDLFIPHQKPALQELIDVYNSHKTNVLAVKEVESKLLKDYGVIDAQLRSKGLYEIKNIVEKPTSSPPSKLAVTGRYVFTSKIYEALNQLTPGSGGELQLTDAIKALLSEENYFAVESSAARFDVGKEEEYLRLCGLLKER
ncbi:UTP--glucose-1-phosphate uridylyltransferase [Guptibacillus hwajinpoensis]|uniref:UTP--glucose-1-phosphate uridylyltransferase n=1 Tax=Guptibacillus hwajinpoensis TaxID=208199 RepID=A0A0J6D0M6_9BACL|nr:UTP--glucose-1-phosphate uridylyltransferase [Alkalihalobacillus macyae]KMM38873.1 UTP--glucose-1-phosphate uridylyltransferase [Alkalihalobacillus macyae]